LDLSDPFKASAEGVRIFLGQSQDGLCTIEGTIELPEVPFGQSLSVAALSPDVLTGGGDPAAILAQLQSGYSVLTNGSEPKYPYAITDLEPGRYLPVPVLTGFGSGGLAMNFIANIFKTQSLKAGETGIADFEYGGVALSGKVTVPQPAEPQPFAYGIVAAKHTSLSKGTQAVLMPTVFLANETGDLEGNYAGQALREHATFQLRVFTSIDDPSPLTSALAWVLNPLSSSGTLASVPTGTEDIELNLTAP
jgi:hypothetical protein